MTAEQRGDDGQSPIVDRLVDGLVNEDPSALEQFCREGAPFVTRERCHAAGLPFREHDGTISDPDPGRAAGQEGGE